MSHMVVKYPLSNVTAVKCPAVKCHLRSNVPRSNVTCGQMSVVKSPAVKRQLRSNVTYAFCGQMSPAVQCHYPPLWSNVHCGLLSCGQMSVVKCPVVKWYCGHRRSTPIFLFFYRSPVVGVCYRWPSTNENPEKLAKRTSIISNFIRSCRNVLFSIIRTTMLY